VDTRLEWDEEGEPDLEFVAERDYGEVEELPAHELEHALVRETFGADPAALKALADFYEQEGSHPPWQHAAELLRDGLIDVHFDLTPRGRRALARVGKQD
jgi:hypothetical protein